MQLLIIFLSVLSGSSFPEAPHKPKCEILLVQQGSVDPHLAGMIRSALFGSSVPAPEDTIQNIRPDREIPNDPIGNLYQSLPWVGRKAPFLPFAELLRLEIRKKGGQIPEELTDRVRTVELASYFEHSLQESPHRVLNESWGSCVHRTDLLDGGAVGEFYVSNHFLPDDLKLMNRSLRLSFNGQIQSVHENRVGRIYFLEAGRVVMREVYDDSGSATLVPVRQQFADVTEAAAKSMLGNGYFWIGFDRYMPDFINGVLGYLSKWLGNPPSELETAVVNGLEELKANGIDPLFVELFHTHPSDAVRISYQHQEPKLFTALLSEKDGSSMLSLRRSIQRAGYRIPVVVSALNGTVFPYLTKACYAIYE